MLNVFERTFNIQNTIFRGEIFLLLSRPSSTASDFLLHTHCRRLYQQIELGNGYKGKLIVILRAQLYYRSIVKRITFHIFSNHKHMITLDLEIRKYFIG